MSLAYIDLKVVPIENQEHISEITWVTEVYNKLDVNHYFVDYPGAKDLERQIIEVVGGNPLVRYSCPVVVKAFLTDTAGAQSIAIRNESQKELLTKLIEQTHTKVPKIITFDEVIEIDGELERVQKEIEWARFEAPRRFGNAI